jgi:glycosyltransferase involved in cell wall biosynthesis
VRILFVNDEEPGPIGGVTIYLSRLIDGLRAAGDDVDVFAGEVTHRGLGKLLDLWDPFARRALAARVERLRPDVVHFHSVLLELSVSVLTAAGDVPTVVSVHDPQLVRGVYRPGMPVRTAVDKFVRAPFNRAVVRRHVDLLLPVSDEVAGWVREAGFSRVEVLPALAPEPLVVPRPVAECHDVVFVGRLAFDKGAHVLVEAFHRIAGRHPAARLVIVGDGPERDKVAATARPLGDRVRMLGQVDQRDVSSVLGSARVVALPYLPAKRAQASSLAMVEAAMHGRPVVAGDDPAIREVASHVGGVQIVTAGSVDELAAALDRLLADPELATERGTQAARGAAAAYSITSGVARLRAFYEGLVRNRRDR